MILLSFFSVLFFLSFKVVVHYARDCSCTCVCITHVHMHTYAHMVFAFFVSFSHLASLLQTYMHMYLKCVHMYTYTRTFLYAFLMSSGEAFFGTPNISYSDSPAVLLEDRGREGGGGGGGGGRECGKEGRRQRGEEREGRREVREGKEIKKQLSRGSVGRVSA